MAIRVKAKEAETVVNRIWKETNKRNVEKAERVGKLNKLLSEAREKYQKAEEAYNTAEESMEPEKMIKARKDRDEAGETVEMYRKAIDKMEAENIYSEEELAKIKVDLRMYSSDIIGNLCVGIGSALEDIEATIKESQAERKSINDLLSTLFNDNTAGVLQVKPPAIETNFMRNILSMRMATPQYFSRRLVVDGHGHIVQE